MRSPSRSLQLPLGAVPALSWCGGVSLGGIYIYYQHLARRVQLIGAAAKARCRVRGIYRVNQAEYGIRILMAVPQAVPQEYVNTYSTCRVGRLTRTWSVECNRTVQQRKLGAE